MTAAFLRMLLVVAGSAQRSAIGQHISQLRELVRMLDVMRDCGLSHSAISRAFFTDITSAAKHFLSPFLVPLLMIEIVQNNQPPALQTIAAVPPLKRMICASA